MNMATARSPENTGIHIPDKTVSHARRPQVITSATTSNGIFKTAFPGMNFNTVSNFLLGTALHIALLN